MIMRFVALNAYVANVIILYPLKTSENQRFLGGKNRNVGRKWIKLISKSKRSFILFTYGSRYSKMNQVKFVGGIFLKNLK